MTSYPRPRLGWLKLFGIWIMLGVAACSPAPSLEFPQDTPSDLQQLVGEVWEEFLAVFADQTDCIGTVVVQGDWNLEGSRAYYLPDETQVVLKIPATAAHLRHSLVHELAHHVEHVCPTHADLRVAFLEAQGTPPDHPWFEGPSWEETPSEQYAETVVRVVLGRPVMHYQVSISPEALEVVKEWGGAS